MTTPAAASTERHSAVAESGNTQGRHTALTLFTPIRRRWVWLVRLSLWVSKWLPMTQKHILQFKFIHMVRWSVIKEWPQNGPPQENDRLKDAYLFFESNFDGPWQQLHRRVRLHHPERHPLPLGPWLCLPGAAPGGALEAMDRREQHGGRHLLQRLPIRLDEDGARRARHPRGVDAPGGRQRSLAPDEFKARYEQFLVEAQAHL